MMRTTCSMLRRTTSMAGLDSRFYFGIFELGREWYGAATSRRSRGERAEIMKFGKTLASAVVLAAGLALAAPVASADGAIQVKFHAQDLTQIISFFNPCNGTEHDTEITFSGLDHLVIRANGTVASNNNLHGTFTDLVTGVTGRFIAINVVAGGDNLVNTVSVKTK